MKIAIVRGDGGVSIMGLSPHVDINDDDLVNRIVSDWASAKPDRVALSWSRIKDDDVPADRTFRSAWRSVDGKVAVDLPAARNIHLAAIREARNRALDESDREAARTNEIGTDAERRALAKRRQALRDVPAAIDAALNAARSPEALKAVWPADVPRPD